MVKPYRPFRILCNRMSGRGKFLVTLTGEHTGALGAIRAHAQHYSGMCVVQIDAHGDLRLVSVPGQSLQSRQCRHGPRGAGWIAAGASGYPVDQPEEIELIDKTPRIKTFLPPRFLDPSGPLRGRAARWIPEVLASRTGPVYLTFDCDGLDASLVPALGTPEPGGLGWYDTLALVTGWPMGRASSGWTSVRLHPLKGFVAPQFSIARLIYRMLGGFERAAGFIKGGW